MSWKSRKYTKRIPAFIGILFLLLFSRLYSVSTHAEEMDSSSIGMNVQYGFEKSGKYGKNIPVNIRITNLEQDFTGKVKIYQPFIGDDLIAGNKAKADNVFKDFFANITRGFMENNPSKTFTYMEEKNIEEIVDAEYKSSFLLPVFSDNYQKFYIEIEDQNENIIYGQEYPIKINSSFHEVFIGILSDSPDAFDYLNRMTLNTQETTLTKTSAFKSETFPEDEKYLDSMDILLIQDFATETLNSKQYDALKKWVKNGGTLLIGSGKRIDETLALFQDGSLFHADVGGSWNRTYRYQSEKEGEKNYNYSILLTIWDVYLKEENSELNEIVESTILHKMKAGQGIVAISGFNWDNAVFRSKMSTSAFTAQILRDAIGKSKMEELEASANSTRNEEYEYSHNILNSVEKDNIPNQKLFTIVLICYVLLAGPGIYLILKKTGKRRHLWICISSVSIAVSGLFFLLGNHTRFTAPFLKYVSILQIDEAEMGKEDIYVSVNAPYSSPYSVSIRPEYDLQLLFNEQEYQNAEGKKYNFQEASYNVRISKETDENEVQIQGLSPFSEKQFKLERELLPEENKGVLQAEVTVFKDVLSGVVTNTTAYDMEDVFIMCYRKLYTVGDVKSGETVRLSAVKAIDLSELFFESGISQFMEQTGNRYTQSGISPIYTVLKFLNRMNFKGYTEEAIIGGFAVSKSALQFQTDQVYETNGITVIKGNIGINYVKDGILYCPYIMDKGKVLSGDEGVTKGRFDLDKAVVEYQLGENMEDIEMYLDFPDAIKSKTQQKFSGSMYFLNRKTNEYDIQNLSKKKYSEKDLEAYSSLSAGVSGGNSIIVKYENNKGEEDRDVILPVLTVTGKERNARN